MKKMEIEIIEKGVQIDTLSHFLPNAEQTLSDEELDAIYGGAVGCNCKFNNCNHCVHVECLKLCRTKLFGDNKIPSSQDTTGTIILR